MELTILMRNNQRVILRNLEDVSEPVDLIREAMTPGEDPWILCIQNRDDEVIFEAWSNTIAGFVVSPEYDDDSISSKLAHLAEAVRFYSESCCDAAELAIADQNIALLQDAAEYINDLEKR